MKEKEEEKVDEEEEEEGESEVSCREGTAMAEGIRGEESRNQEVEINDE